MHPNCTATRPGKGTSIPYITHLMAVASTVGENSWTENEVIAALLHDAIEDTDATYEMIKKRFDKDVADIVQACSDTDVIPKPEWEKRKKDYIVHVVKAPKSVRLVSASDKLHNAREPRRFLERPQSLHHPLHLVLMAHFDVGPCLIVASEGS